MYICILIFSLVLVAKLFLIQIVHSESYSSRADRQYFTPSSDIFERGSIYFTRKDGEFVSAATQTTGFKLAIAPSKLGSVESSYQKLSNVVPISKDEFLKKAEKKQDPYEEVASHLTKEEADAIATLGIPGTSIHKEKWRFYPGGNMSSQTLGFVGYNGDVLSGRYGIERKYDDVLSRDKDNPYVNFFAEVFSNINKTLFKKEEMKGDVVTTIEPAVQGFLEKKLQEVKGRYQVDSIGGIIMNPKNGAIYALGLKPDFNPNDLSSAQTSNLGNPLVENVYEWGSVVKPLVMASAIDAGVLNAYTTYNDTGSVIVEKKEIFNFDKKGRGPGTSMQEVLSQSLNTGMVFAFHKLGKAKMHDYMLSFGIKEKTGIDLPNETAGLVSGLTNNLRNAREIEYTNASFGQGIALSPVSITRSLASLANGGNLVVPHVVEKIKYDNGTEKEMTYPTTRAKITEATSEEITRMLVVVMDDALQGGLAKIENYSVAIKTGTAQVANNISGGYYEDRHIHSFVGYFPAYDPEFIVFLYAVNPKGVRYASETWANPFLDVTKFLISYYEVPPDR